jgi:hypothetical protein
MRIANGTWGDVLFVFVVGALIGFGATAVVLLQGALERPPDSDAVVRGLLWAWLTGFPGGGLAAVALCGYRIERSAGAAPPAE